MYTRSCGSSELGGGGGEDTLYSQGYGVTVAAVCWDTSGDSGLGL
jgi:hypothetical protein